MRSVIQRVRRVPFGIWLFLAYAFAILAGIGVSLRYVVDLAVGAPVSGPGVVVMVLLAYTVFTTTLVIQRKRASRALATGLASLTIPLAVLLLYTGLIVQGIVVSVLAIVLIRGLRSRAVQAYLVEE